MLCFSIIPADNDETKSEFAVKLYEEREQVSSRNPGTLTVLPEDLFSSRTVAHINFHYINLDDKVLYSISVRFKISISKILIFFPC